MAPGILEKEWNVHSVDPGFRFTNGTPFAKLSLHMSFHKRTIRFIICMFVFSFLSIRVWTFDFPAARKKMVQTQLIERSLLDPGLLEAFGKVERHLFVDEQYWPLAYADTDLPIGFDQTIESPYVVAFLTHVITAQNHQRVLEIGTGTGYQAAILSLLVKEVYSIELVPELGRMAGERLKRLGYLNVRTKIGNGYQGWREYAPFDGIIVTCSPDHIPQALIDQLAEGGRMIIPITFSKAVEEMVLVEKGKNGRLKKTNLVPPLFAPLFRGKNEF